MKENSETNLPKELGKPAERAFAAAGYHHLEQFTQVSEAELLKLHGVGSKALGVLRNALSEKGLAFKKDS
jgi:DNA-directed RNA polymerase alpha subunit